MDPNLEPLELGGISLKLDAVLVENWDVNTAGFNIMGKKNHIWWYFANRESNGGACKRRKIEMSEKTRKAFKYSVAQTKTATAQIDSDILEATKRVPKKPTRASNVQRVLNAAPAAGEATNNEEDNKKKNGNETEDDNEKKDD